MFHSNDPEQRWLLIWLHLQSFVEFFEPHHLQRFTRDRPLETPWSSLGSPWSSKESLDSDRPRFRMATEDRTDCWWPILPNSGLFSRYERCRLMGFRIEKFVTFWRASEFRPKTKGRAGSLKWSAEFWLISPAVGRLIRVSESFVRKNLNKS